MSAAKTKQQLLDELKERIEKSGVTPELKAGATQLVFADGNPDADIVFIGEAPGKNEDLQGKPFVGASGKFLGEMLEMIDMKREDIYITNIVKYRPPNNRDPLPAEKEAFLPFLQEQLDIIGPKIDCHPRQAQHGCAAARAENQPGAWPTETVCRQGLSAAVPPGRRTV
ncbi:MAG: uracil-DNA glycosylase [Candidatus Saccharibacteria bacterium]